MLIHPRTPPGTLELLPRGQMTHQHMIDTIRKGFERFGFVPVETPVFELKDVLLTKSGGETEKQVYFVQSTGALQQGHEADLALHFDLTVPLARYVAEHERELAFPFRRYQIQRVYRGERAQKGRFREFYQCDIDVIGKDKLDPAYDAEIPAIIVQIFERLGIGDFTIHFSNRKILLGFLLAVGVDDAEKRTLIMREVDKFDKIGKEKTRESIIAQGLNFPHVDNLIALLEHKDSNDETLRALRAMNVQNQLFQQGLAELTQMVMALKALGVPEKRVKLDLKIARGLDYYTGTVYETFIDAHPEFGSVCSGGRYDDLAGYYTKSKLPGVGISIGLTRLFDQLRSNNLLPPAPHTTHILIAQLDPQLSAVYLALGAELRAAGFNVENYLEPAKLEKQLKYADKSGIPFAILLGPDEQEKKCVIIKDLAAKAQSDVPRAALIDRLRALVPRKP
ncbi:MAG TPA: histidine--tRNA ligase [Alphaproteobacteria bacterium]|nr:histidine--tRNA ligase [Alphaproteobacteria bacterium]